MTTWDDAFPLSELKCTDRAGELRHFQVRVQIIGERNDRMGVDCRIRPSPPTDVGEALYFASFSEVEPGLLQLYGLRNMLPEKFHGCGLTRTLIPIIAEHYGKRVRSSTTRATNEEMRTPAATASWDHMVRDGIASYNIGEDRYYYPTESVPAR
jgi:hypothetical protein